MGYSHRRKDALPRRNDRSIDKLDGTRRRGSREADGYGYGEENRCFRSGENHMAPPDDSLPDSHLEPAARGQV